MQKHFMIDIETTGTEPLSEDLLQIGLLEVDYQEGYWRPGRSLEITQHSGRKPESIFAKENMVDLYEKCNKQHWISPIKIREQLLSFISDCGSKSPEVYLMGWNASNFDVPFLIHHRCLVPSSYAPAPNGKEMMVGDFHYRIYEIGGAISIIQNTLDYEDRKELVELAEKVGKTIITIPEGKKHTALYDCYLQTQLLNGLISITRTAVLRHHLDSVVGS